MNTGSPSLDAQSEYTALADFRLAPSSSPAKGPQVSHAVRGEAEKCAVYFNQFHQEQKTLDRTNQCNRNRREPEISGTMEPFRLFRMSYMKSKKNECFDHLG